MQRHSLQALEVVHAQFHVAPRLDEALAVRRVAAGHWFWRPDVAELGRRTG